MVAALTEKAVDQSREGMIHKLQTQNLHASIDQGLSHSGMAMGTVGYMSPEQVRGEQLDIRTDLFSFGLILFEMATGRRAFCGDMARIVQDAILNHTPPPARELNPNVPSGLERLIQKCLEKNPDRRYQLAADIRSDLQWLIRDADAQHGVVLADEVVGEQVPSQISGYLDSIAVLPFENAGGEPDMEYLSDGIATSLINNLSQLNKLRVVPRSTAFRYKGRVSDASQAGRELRVRVVLTGHVTQRGDELTINVELIDSTHESQLWGGNYHGRLEDIRFRPRSPERLRIGCGCD
jgi:TolB-like protein